MFYILTNHFSGGPENSSIWDFFAPRKGSPLDIFCPIKVNIRRNKIVPPCFYPCVFLPLGRRIFPLSLSLSLQMCSVEVFTSDGRDDSFYPWKETGSLPRRGGGGSSPFFFCSSYGIPDSRPRVWGRERERERREIFEGICSRGILPCLCEEVPAKKLWLLLRPDQTTTTTTTTPLFLF